MPLPGEGDCESGGPAASRKREDAPDMMIKSKSKKQKKRNPICRVFKHLVHCCARHNDVASAVVLYFRARPSSYSDSYSYLIKKSSLPAIHPRIDEELAMEEDFLVDGRTYAALLSLCDGVSPSDYLQSGAPNKPTLLKDNEDVPAVSECSYAWDADIMDMYSNLRSAAVQAVPGERKVSSVAGGAPPMLLPSVPHRFAFAKLLMGDMEARKLPLNEISYTAFIRMACRASAVRLAEDHLRRALDDAKCKKRNRLFFDLLRLYCIGPSCEAASAQQPDGTAGSSRVPLSLDKALGLWSRMLACGLTITEDEYCLFLRCATSFGDAAVAEKVISDIAEDILVPASSTREALVNWFLSPSAAPAPASSLAASAAPSLNLLKKHNLPNCSPVLIELTDDSGRPTRPPVNGYRVERGLSDADGNLPCGDKLKSIDINVDKCIELMDMNTQIVHDGQVEGHVSPYCGGGKGKKSALTGRQLHNRRAAWESFISFLRANGESIDVVIDGANVGYYQMNFSESPRMDWLQIDWVVRELEAKNLKCLVVLHSRHFTERMCPPKFKHVVERWEGSGSLLKTPLGMNDDWFWLHASLWKGFLQHENRKVTGEAGSSAVRNLPFFISNDELRDHKFMMMQARELCRWKERRAVKFSFGEWDDDRRCRVPIFAWPCKYSKRIQAREGGGGLHIPELMLTAAVDKIENGNGGGAAADGGSAKKNDAVSKVNVDDASMWTSIIPVKAL